MKSGIISTGTGIELFGGEYEFIDSGFNTGQYNMDFDMDRTRLVSEGKALPMFRLYAWKPWAVSLGYNQKAEDIDSEECQKLGFDIVRRPTGGRAVLHADELTYSVVIQVPENKTVHDIYREIHVILVSAFEKLGCSNLEFHKSQPDFKSLYKDNGMSVSCFASSARYEISFEGKKIVGSAQRLFGNTLLQHGSIPLGPGYEKLALVAKTRTPERKKALLEYMLSHSSTLGNAAGREISYKDSAEAVCKSLK